MAYKLLNYFKILKRCFDVAFSVILAYTISNEITDSIWAGRKTQVHPRRGSSPPFFYKRSRGDKVLEELSIFIDESGDFGEYDHHSPYYIITMVFHNQQEDIQPAISKLNHELSYLNLENLSIHTGSIIRKEEIYINMSVNERRRIFNKMVAFIRRTSIRYKCFYIEKKHISDAIEATGKLSKQISARLCHQNISFFRQLIFYALWN